MEIDPHNPILDQPQVIEYDDIHPDATYRLANQDLRFEVDAKTDLHQLFWPWADMEYVRTIRLRISDPHADELMALVTRYYAGYQETILGNEGMIISKRLTVPLASHYDRAVLWMLECQAEGDRLMRLDVHIDWGEPLSQRIVDGLLVAQVNPQRAQGIYQQKNADSTRVFGNPHGRPSQVELDDETGTANLVYYVLINGIVDVPLILTISDVGEQVAWNGFLALRDAERAFELSVEAWKRAVKQGRLWTSDPQLNRAVHAGRMTSLRHFQRLRTGMAPADRKVEQVPDLVKSLDTYDRVQSRNLLAHIRRIAERSDGKLPILLPVHPKEQLVDPGPQVANTNVAYLTALSQHLQRHPDPSLLDAHYAAVGLCTENLVRLQKVVDARASGELIAIAARGVRMAVALAMARRDNANAARWETNACDMEQLARDAHVADLGESQIALDRWQETIDWQLLADRPWHFADAEQGIRLAGDAVWHGCGIQWRRDLLWVYPSRTSAWRWWALLNLPYGDEHISLVWDGSHLFSTRPVQSDCPVTLCTSIQALHTEELDFNLRFEMRLSTLGDSQATDGDSQMEERHTFAPTFDQG